jgi:predicted nucleic acid-binding protein
MPIGAATMTQSNSFFDTNIIGYFASINTEKARISARLLKRGGIVSVQVLNEFANFTLRKRELTFLEIKDVLLAVRSTCAVVPLSVETHDRALLIAERHRLHLYDAMIIAAALLAGCATLYTEDMHDGLSIDGLTIRNPYAGLG